MGRSHSPPALTNPSAQFLDLVRIGEKSGFRGLVKSKKSAMYSVSTESETLGTGREMVEVVETGASITCEAVSMKVSGRTICS